MEDLRWKQSEFDLKIRHFSYVKTFIIIYLSFVGSSQKRSQLTFMRRYKKQNLTSLRTKLLSLVYKVRTSHLTSYRGEHVSHTHTHTPGHTNEGLVSTCQSPMPLTAKVYWQLLNQSAPSSPPWLMLLTAEHQHILGNSNYPWMSLASASAHTWCPTGERRPHTTTQ